MLCWKQRASLHGDPPIPTTTTAQRRSASRLQPAPMRQAPAPVPALARPPIFPASFDAPSHLPSPSRPDTHSHPPPGSGRAAKKSADRAEARTCARHGGGSSAPHGCGAASTSNPASGAAPRASRGWRGREAAQPHRIAQRRGGCRVECLGFRVQEDWSDLGDLLE